MSAVQSSPVWHNSESNSKHEKCRHITEEIYKRIDITFQIKSLETGCGSDASNGSDQIDIDSNELSNGTDLFACDKSDSIPSSASERDGATRVDKFVNVNNNEIRKSVVPIYRRPKKRFRKRIKKRPTKGHRTDSEGSSDEGAPLSKIVDPPDARQTDSGMGVPKITILTSAGVARIKETKPKTPPPPAPPAPAADTDPKGKEKKDPKQCSMCSLTCRGERGLRRHMAMSHILIPEDITRPIVKKTDQRYEKLASN